MTCPDPAQALVLCAISLPFTAMLVALAWASFAKEE